MYNVCVADHFFKWKARVKLWQQERGYGGISTTPLDVLMQVGYRRVGHDLVCRHSTLV